MFFNILFFLAFIVSCYASEVVILDTNNFEHLTQASTGATTGDWLIKFYAPWCGHCKKLEPIYEEVANALKGEVNVAKVDVTANRELGTRFEIKGFPTIKLLSKGKQYTFKGRRTVDAFVEFARGGYQIQSAEEVQPPLGFFGEITYVFKDAYKQAVNDLRRGNYLSVNVFLAFLPIMFLIVVSLLFCLPPLPEPEYPQRTYKSKARTEQTEQAKTEPEEVTSEQIKKDE